MNKDKIDRAERDKTNIKRAPLQFLPCKAALFSHAHSIFSREAFPFAALYRVRTG